MRRSIIEPHSLFTDTFCQSSQASVSQASYSIFYYSNFSFHIFPSSLSGFLKLLDPALTILCFYGSMVTEVDCFIRLCNVITSFYKNSARRSFLHDPLLQGYVGFSSGRLFSLSFHKTSHSCYFSQLDKKKTILTLYSHWRSPFPLVSAIYTRVKGQQVQANTEKNN